MFIRKAGLEKGSQKSIIIGTPSCVQRMRAIYLDLPIYEIGAKAKAQVSVTPPPKGTEIKVLSATRIVPPPLARPIHYYYPTSVGTGVYAEYPTSDIPVTRKVGSPPSLIQSEIVWLLLQRRSRYLV